MTHAEFREMLEKQTTYNDGEPNQQVSMLLDAFNKLPDVAAILNSWIDKEATRNCAVQLSWLKEQLNNIVGGNESNISFNYIDVAEELEKILDAEIKKEQQRADDVSIVGTLIWVLSKLKELSK